jgi:hypothetical protein
MQNIPAEHLSLAAQLDQEILSGGLQPADCIVMKPVSFNNSVSDQSHLNEQGKKSVKKARRKKDPDVMAVHENVNDRVAR